MGESALPATHMTPALDRGQHKRRPLSIATSLVFLLGLTGCVSVTRLVPESYPPSQHVEILLRAPEERPYTAIARLSTTTVFHSVEAAVDRLVGKGRQLGADAIVIGIFTTQGTQVQEINLFPIYYNRGGYSSVSSLNATAIRFTDRPGPKE